MKTWMKLRIYRKITRMKIRNSEILDEGRTIKKSIHGENRPQMEQEFSLIYISFNCLVFFSLK